MNRSNFIFPIASLIFAFLLASAPVFGQAVPTPVEPSHDVTLQIIIGSNEGAGQPLPADLNGISRQLKGSFAFTNYRLAETFLGRVGDRGDLEYKSVFNFLDAKSDSELQSFLEWSIRGLRTIKDTNDKTVMQAEILRFGGRVPVKFPGDPAGRVAPTINYEGIGLNLTRLTLPIGAPTLVGSITMTKALGTMFVVITVKPTA